MATPSLGPSTLDELVLEEPTSWQILSWHTSSAWYGRPTQVSRAKFNWRSRAARCPYSRLPGVLENVSSQPMHQHNKISNGIYCYFKFLHSRQQPVVAWLIAYTGLSRWLATRAFVLGKNVLSYCVHACPHQYPHPLGHACHTVILWNAGVEAGWLGEPPPALHLRDWLHLATVPAKVLTRTLL